MQNSTRLRPQFPEGDSSPNRFSPPRAGRLAGDKDAESALTKTARYLGLGISNLLKGLSPEVVIVGGRIAKAWPVIEAEVKDTVEKNTICRDLPSARITASTLGENPTLMGALSLILANRFAAHH